MNRIIGIVFLLFVGFHLQSQQTNPFDITKRKESTLLNADTLPKMNMAVNAVVKDSITVSPSGDLKPAEATKFSENNKAGDLPTAINNSGVSKLETQLQKLIDENPFNVSRIPLKKKKLNTEVVEKSPEVKEREAFEITEETTDKNLDDTSMVVENIKEPTSYKKRIQIGSNKFIFWVLFLQMLLLSSLIGINRNFISKIWRSITNDNFAKLVSRDYNNGYTIHFIILYVLFLLSLALYIFIALKAFYDLNGILNYLLILGGVSAVYGIRHIFQNTTASIFPFGKASSYYDFMIIIFNSFLGLVLIPMNVLGAYAPPGLAVIGIYIGLILIVIIYLLRFLRGSLNAYTFIRNYLFHFFLYLCTCEIAPVFILMKLLSKSFIT